jgi:hypothetical protein
MTCNLHQLSSLSKLSIVCRELLQEQGSSAEISSASPSFKQVQFHSKQAALRPHQLQFAALIQAIVSDKRLAWPVWNPVLMAALHIRCLVTKELYPPSSSALGNIMQYRHSKSAVTESQKLSFNS